MKIMIFKITVVVISFIANLYLTSAQSECSVNDFEDGELGTSESCAFTGAWVVGSYEDTDIAAPSSWSSNYIITGDSMFSCIASETIDMVQNGVIQILYYAEGSIYLGVMGMEGSDAFINEAINVNIGVWTTVTFSIPRDLSGQIHITGSPTADNSRLLIDSFGYANSEENIEYCFSRNITLVTSSTTAESTEDVTTQPTTASPEQLTTIASTTSPQEGSTTAEEVTLPAITTPLPTTNIEEVTTPLTTTNVNEVTTQLTTTNLEEVTTSFSTTDLDEVTTPSATTNPDEYTTSSTLEGPATQAPDSEHSTGIPSETIASAEVRFWNVITITGAAVTIAITMFTVGLCAYEIGQRRAINQFKKLQASEYGLSVSSLPTSIPRIKLQTSNSSIQRTQSFYDYY